MTALKHLAPLPEGVQERLRDELRERGEDEVCDLLGISRIAVLRSAAGVGVMRGTRSLIARGLDELDDDDGDDPTDADDLDDDADDEEGEDDDDDDDDLDEEIVGA